MNSDFAEIEGCRDGWRRGRWDGEGTFIQIAWSTTYALTRRTRAHGSFMSPRAGVGDRKGWLKVNNGKRTLLYYLTWGNALIDANRHK